MAQIDSLTQVGLINATDLALIIRAGGNVLATVGTMAAQGSDAVDITGGDIDGTPIGATTPSTVAGTTLDITGAFTAGTAAWAIGATQLVKTANGDLLVGTSDVSQTAGVGTKLLSSATVPNISQVVNTAAGMSTYHLYNTNATNNGYRFFVNVNGGISNFSASNANLSDRNAKKDIDPHMESEWETVRAWEIVDFRYKDEPTGTPLKIGVIAQQIQEHSPDLVMTFQEAAKAVEEVLDDNGEVIVHATPAQEHRIGVNEPQMMWKVTKALQEAMTRIEILESTLPAAGI